MKKSERQIINRIYTDLLEEAVVIQNELTKHDYYSDEFKSAVLLLQICHAKLEVIQTVIRRTNI